MSSRKFPSNHEKLGNDISVNTREIERKNTKTRKRWANAQLIEIIQKRDKNYKLEQNSNNNEYHSKMFKKYKIKARNLKNFLKTNYYKNQIS